MANVSSYFASNILANVYSIMSYVLLASKLRVILLNFITIFVLLFALDILSNYFTIDMFTSGVFKGLCLDAPRPWGIYFQDSATPQMEGLVELHDNIMFYLVIILFAVGWILLSIIKNYINYKITYFT